MSMHQMQVNRNTQKKNMHIKSTYNWTRVKHQQVNDSRQLWSLNPEVLSWGLNLPPHDPQA